jgi:hypothetical protein
VKVAALLPAQFYSDAEERCVGQDWEEKHLEADYRRVGPAFRVGLEEAAMRGWVDNVRFSLDFWDSQCNAIEANKAWEDLHLTHRPGKPHILLGPSCDLPLYSLFARRHWIQERVPVLTGGGLAPFFSAPKQWVTKTLQSPEYYMLTKTGVSFTDAAKAFVRFMQENGWSKFILAYRRTEGHSHHQHDHLEWSGDYSCNFLAEALKEQADAKGFNWQFLELEARKALSPPVGEDIREYYIQTNQTWLVEMLPPTNKR